MLLEIGTTGAVLGSLGLASFFVLSLYMWIPFEKKDKNKVYDENSTEEVTKRIISVTMLSALAFVFILIGADFDKRPEVGILKWFGLQLGPNEMLAISFTLTLNFILYLGEFVQFLIVIEFFFYGLGHVRTNQGKMYSYLIQKSLLSKYEI